MVLVELDVSFGFTALRILDGFDWWVRAGAGLRLRLRASIDRNTPNKVIASPMLNRSCRQGSAAWGLLEPR